MMELRLTFNKGLCDGKSCLFLFIGQSPFHQPQGVLAMFLFQHLPPDVFQLK